MSKIFILGRQPEIGLAELRAVFGEAELILPQVALVPSDNEPNIDRLGSVRKVGRVIFDADGDPDDFLIEKFRELPAGKITLGISHYGRTATAKTANQTAMFIKKKLDRSVRVLPNSEAEIADAATLGNKLGSSPNKVELLMAYVGHRLIVAELTGVQNLNSYTLRDRGRPKRDARVGMLPPKLAQVMINLASGAGETDLPTPPVLLDPFCGTGVILQEAALMGLRPYGTDLEPRMIDYSRANLEWLHAKLLCKTRSYKKESVKLAAGDATTFRWDKPIDFIATETYLGQPYASPPPSEKLQHNITTCNTIISKFLANLAPQITSGTGLCVAVPCWFLNNKTYHLPLTRQLATFDYEQIYYSASQKPLIYHRENQIVGRELLVLRKKSE
jgi:tRNA (guanine10-N2)-dimethyltransferase